MFASSHWQSTRAGTTLSPSKISPVVQSSTLSAKGVRDVDVSSEIPRKLANLHTIQTLQGPMLTESLAIRANHADIARNVQKILQLRPPDFRQWKPPSKAYMSAPISCQICNISVTDIFTTLVCDALEKAVHLKCLQSYNQNQRGIPKGDWHYLKCLIASNGHPFPPKYGRVGKSTNVWKMPANKSSHQASPVKKLETSHPKILLHTIVSNGLNAAPEVPIQVEMSHSNNMHILQEIGNTSGDLRSNSKMSFAESRKNAEDRANEPLNHDSSQTAPEGVLLRKLPENENNCSPTNTVSQFSDQESAHSSALVSASHFGYKGSQTKHQSNNNLHVVKQPQTSSSSQGADRLAMQQEASASETLLQNNEIHRVLAESKGFSFSQLPISGQNCADKGVKIYSLGVRFPDGNRLQRRVL